MLRTRFGTPQHALAQLFGVVTAQRPTTDQTSEQGKHTIKLGPVRLRTLAELTTYAAANGIALTPGIKSAF